ncbi:MAG TPA: glycogen debranching N-terminal domain-containing protein, partial [Candidatus Limnocylindrales bacterium]
AEHGFFARDSRFVSGYELSINGRRPLLLNSSPIQFFSSRFEFTNDRINDPNGPIEPHTISLRLDRTIAGGVHEDYDVINYGRRTVRLAIEIRLESDFADIFDVKSGAIVRRGELNTRWFQRRAELRTDYVNGDFHRQLIVEVDRASSRPQFANGRLVFVALVPPKDVWHTCLRWLPVTGSRGRPSTLACSAIAEPLREVREHRLPLVRLDTSNGTVRHAWDQAVDDLEALRLEDPTFERSVVIPAAGVPWFVTLFGRDSLTVSLQVVAGYPEFADGALRRLSALQATQDDAERDMEPGKVPHEIRHGELAQLGILPYTPYYGTHDATSLFLIVLSLYFDWLGDAGLIERYLPAAEAALAWIDRYGDRDGDGFQEYATRSSRGYRNQGWKDAYDAIPHEDGSLSPLPTALVELQGYAYDAKVRLARLYEVIGRSEQAGRLRRDAESLFERVNDAFWWEAEGTYYLGLDGDKRPIRTIASNPGHLLSSGIVPSDRAARVVERLMRDDLYSGWGIRTLSSDHPAYNPFSYHTGSVWPHDNAIIADGFRRYGFAREAAAIAGGMFDAAGRLVAYRLPELFAGLPRQPGSFPVQYLGANVPQAWASGAVIHLVGTLAGIRAHSDGRESMISVDPALPEWLPDLTLRNLRAGRGSLSLRILGGTAEVLENTTGFRVDLPTVEHSADGGVSVR